MSRRVCICAFNVTHGFANACTYGVPQHCCANDVAYDVANSVACTDRIAYTFSDAITNKFADDITYTCSNFITNNVAYIRSEFITNNLAYVFSKCIAYTHTDNSANVLADGRILGISV